MKSTKILESLNRLTFARPNDSGPIFILKKGLQKIRALFTKIWDPIITFNIDGKTLMIPLSHRFPNFISEWPLYDTALPRLCQFIFKEFNYLKMIDVGANIGETVSLVSAKIDGDYLCIEPSTKFFKILKKNTERNDKIVVDNHLIGETKELIIGKVKSTRGGTASLQHKGKSTVEIISLDELIYQNKKNFIDANIIKIDTDGFDLKVLRGAKKIIQTAKPILFFELAPTELIAYGKDDPYSIFPLLENLGYQQFLIYDNYGFLISSFQKANLEVLNGIVDYALNKTTMWIWLDVIAFHNDYRDPFIRFYELERLTIQELVSKIPTYKKKFHKFINLLFKR